MPVANLNYKKYTLNPSGYPSFQDFYPFYLGEHGNTINRRLHVIGTTFVILMFLYSIFTAQYSMIKWCPVLGYGFAWVGHFFFEKNKPATFKHPFYSLAGDFKLWSEVATMQRPF